MRRTVVGVKTAAGRTLRLLTLVGLALTGAVGIAPALELQPLAPNNGSGHGNYQRCSLDYTIGQSAIGLPVGTS